MAGDSRAHIVEKANAPNNYLVELPDSTNEELSPSCVRAKTEIISLTTNNLAYIRTNVLGWWAAYPVPATAPPEFQTGRFVQNPGWGWARIVESRVAGLPAGSRIFGYIPYATSPFILNLRAGELEGHYEEVTETRRAIHGFYNRYRAESEVEFAKKGQTTLGLEVLTRTVSEGSGALNRYVLAWDRSQRVHPLVPNDKVPWNVDTDGDVKDGIVCVFAASGKSALALAHHLKYSRPEGQKPKAVVAVVSDKSVEFVKKTGLYDHVFLYNQIDAGRSMVASNKADGRILIVDFGGRDGAGDKWYAALKADTGRDMGHLCLAVPTKPETRGTTASFGHIKASAIALVGEAEYFSTADRDWETFKKHSALISGEQIWSSGLEAVKEGWSKVASGQFDASKGLVYRL